MHLCSYTNSLKVLVKQDDQLILFQTSNVSSIIITKVLVQVFFNQWQVIKKPAFSHYPYYFSNLCSVGNC